MKPKSFYINFFFLLLILNFIIDIVISQELTWSSLFFAIVFTNYIYLFDNFFGIDKNSKMFKYEEFRSIDGKRILKIRVEFDDPEGLGLNDHLPNEYVKNVPYGLFGVPWGKPKAEWKLVSEVTRDLKKNDNEY